MQINDGDDKLLLNLLLCMGIGLGTICAERALDIDSGRWFHPVMALIAYSLGWAGFIALDISRDAGSDNRMLFGIAIPLLSLAWHCQIAQRADIMRSIAGRLMIVVTLASNFAAWILYIVSKSQKKSSNSLFGDVDGGVLKYNLLGIGLIILGTFQYYASDTARLNLGRLSRLFHYGLFNHALAVLATGWAFLAIGNSFE